MKRTEQLNDLAQTLAIAFVKVAADNPNGLTDSWVLFQSRNAYGIFLTPRRCLKVGGMARASYALIQAVGAWK